MRPLVVFVLCFVVCNAHALTLAGRVIRVQDGDSLVLIDSDTKQHHIRINGIDAPEKGQPYGDRSRQNMVRMVAGKDVTADCHKTDRYGRQVCKVWVQPSDCPKCGKTLDAGHAQIIAGMAWWYREYAKEQSAEDRGRYESDENEARLRKRGLWQQDSQVPPWDWRKNLR